MVKFAGDREKEVTKLLAIINAADQTPAELNGH
jgi:hypothetical protein